MNGLNKIFAATLFCFVVLMACVPNAYAAPTYPPTGGWGGLCWVKSFYVILAPGVKNYSGTANCQGWIAYSDQDAFYNPWWVWAVVTFEGSYNINSKKYVEHISFEYGRANWNEFEGNNNLNLNGGGTCNDDPWRTTAKCDGYSPGSIVKAKYSWDLVPLETAPLSRYIFGFAPGGLQKLVASTLYAVADPMATKPYQTSAPKGGKQVGVQKTMSASGGTTGAPSGRSAVSTAIRSPLPDLAFGYVIVEQRTYSVAGGAKPIILSYFNPSSRGGNPSGGCERPYSFPLKVNVKNIGQADFAPKDSSQAVAVNIGPWNRTMDLKKIGKGDSQSMDFNVSLPPGKYTLKAAIDLHNGVAESRADNNTLSWPLEVKCDPALLPAAVPSGLGGKQMPNPQPQPPKENAQGKQLPAVQTGSGGKHMLNPQSQPPKENAQGKQLPAVQK